MAITYDGVVDNSASSANEVTVGAYAPTGTDRLAIGLVGGGSNGNSQFCDNVDRGAEAFTEDFEERYQTYFFHGIWHYYSPSTSSTSTIFDLSKNGEVFAAVIYINGAQQSGQPRDTDSDFASSGTSSTITLTTVSGDFCCDANGQDADSTPTAGGSQNAIWEEDLPSNPMYGDGSYIVASGATQVMSWSWSGSVSQGRGLLGGSFIPSAAAGATHIDLDRGFRRGQPSGLFRGVA
jgi:hypothetical protein